MTHLIIIWSNALEHKDRILEDINNSFSVRKIFHIEWDKQMFLRNLRIFYSHSQSHLPYNRFVRMFNSKMKHCGNEPFLAIIADDPNPKMENRETSSGTDCVNAHIFDKKQLYRDWTGGGHRIHTSNNDWETNKDLTILFGLNTEDFLIRYPTQDQTIEELHRNVTGCGGYESMRQFFYVLNNSTNYCVLRNFEGLPDQYTVQGHGDIDILTTSKRYLWYLTEAEDVYKYMYRVAFKINIGGQKVDFDFRSVRDNYYDMRFEKDILLSKILLPSGIYVPNDEYFFYSLLYHAYIQKKAVADDYIGKLKTAAEKVGLSFDGTREHAIKLLDTFMEKHNYEYVQANDLSVHFNKDNLQLSHWANRHGKLVSQNIVMPDEAEVHFCSIVYENEKSFYKRADKFLIDNEVSVLRRLEKYDCFPKVINTGEANDGCFFEMTKIEGENAFSFFNKPKNNTLPIIRQFVEQTLHILQILTENNIMHRDLRETNYLISRKGDSIKVSIIDFGWAADITNLHNAKNPLWLGGEYKPENGYSDYYSFGYLLSRLWPFGLSYINRIATPLLQITQDDYLQSEQLERNIQIVWQEAKQAFSLADKILVLPYRLFPTNTIIFKLKRKLRKIILRFRIKFLLK